MANLMRKMWTSDQIKKIASGERPAVMVTGRMTDMDGNTCVVVCNINLYNDNGVYYVDCVDAENNAILSRKINFVELKVYNDTDVEIPLDGSTLELYEIVTGNLLGTIDI